MADKSESLLKKWVNYCNSQALPKEAAAAKLGINPYDYKLILGGTKQASGEIMERMQRILDRRDILDQTVLRTSLLIEMESFIKRGLSEKVMITLAAPTGQGKSHSAKYLARQYGCRYLQILTTVENKKTAAKAKLIYELETTFGLKEMPRHYNSALRCLIDNISTDTRQVLIVDEAQRLYTDDWGYYKVLQDLLDNVPTLSIIMLGNYKFYASMFTDSKTTMQGVLDQEQFLRRVSLVHKLPRLQARDVKIWSEYNGITLNAQEHKRLAEFFSARAGLASLEDIRREIIRMMGGGAVKTWDDVTAEVIHVVYKSIHTKDLRFSEADNENKKEEDSFETVSYAQPA